MWILPSRSRPASLKRFFDQYQITRATSEGVVWLDNDDEKLAEYRAIELPQNWRLEIHPRMPLGVLINKCYELYPHEKWYGLLADDLMPRTYQWDRKLIEAAGDDYLAYGNDLLKGEEIATHPCIGGELIKDLGYIAVPGLDRLYIDTALQEYARKNGKLKYLPDVITEHFHFSNNKAPYDAVYEKHNGDKDAQIYKEWHDIMIGNKGMVICCVNWGNYCGRGKEYVNILHDSVRRNLPDTFEGRFVCFTDNPDGLNEGIETILLPEGVKGWWNKLYIFKDGHFRDGERVLFLDLDTIITGALDEIVTYKGKLGMLSDFYNPNNIAGGVIAFEANTLGHIWDKWIEDGKPDYDGSHEEGFGESYYIQKLGIKADRLQEVFPHMIVSYKIHARFEIPDKARIVCFHGEPRPHEAGAWVPDFWKIGGCTTFYSKVVGNTKEEILIRNMHHAMALGLERLKPVEPHNRHAVIIGGGPSLKDDVENIRQHKLEGATLFSTNKTYEYLEEHYIRPDYHIMLDARPEMAEFVPAGAMCYYASQCNPSVFEAAKRQGCDVYLWHHFATDIARIMPKGSKNEPLVGMGTSVGLKAIAIAHILGYRTIHLYGFDSSYENDQNHAYEQALNKGEKVLDITMNGQKYKAAPWMCTQVEEFKEIIPHLVKDSAIIMHGRGLLPDICGLFSNSLENNVEYNYTNQSKEMAYA